MRTAWWPLRYLRTSPSLFAAVAIITHYVDTFTCGASVKRVTSCYQTAASLHTQCTKNPKQQLQPQSLTRLATDIAIAPGDPHVCLVTHLTCILYTPSPHPAARPLAMRVRCQHKHEVTPYTCVLLDPLLLPHTVATTHIPCTHFMAICTCGASVSTCCGTGLFVRKRQERVMMSARCARATMRRARSAAATA